MRSDLIISVVLAVAYVSVASAEVIHIPVGQQAPEKHDLPRPVRGMIEDRVLEHYGLPDSRSGPVGDPPISIWRYPNYTVYFESETVIHSVLTHTSKVDVTNIEQE